MSNLTDITSEEAAWLVQAIVNTYHQMDEPINFSEITPEYISKEIRTQRNINCIYGRLKINTDEVLAGSRKKEDVMEGVFSRPK